MAAHILSFYRWNSVLLLFLVSNMGPLIPALPAVCTIFNTEATVTLLAAQHPGMPPFCLTADCALRRRQIWATWLDLREIKSPLPPHMQIKTLPCILHQRRVKRLLLLRTGDFTEGKLSCYGVIYVIRIPDL